MTLYVQIDSEDEKFVKKTIISAAADAAASQKTAFNLARLKKSKTGAMIGTSAATRDIEKEIEKMKMALPDVKEKPFEERPKAAEKTEEKIFKAKPKSKKGYEGELESIKERISKL
jgi:hypothetical protein